MNNKPKGSTYVSASDAGRAAFCPHYLELQYKGVAVSTAANVARQKGNAAHDALNKQVEDKRCFIASYLYGVDDRRTVRLRKFRDGYLTNCWSGRMFISVYYRLSPLIIWLAIRIRIIHFLTEKAVSWFERKLEE